MARAFGLGTPHAPPRPMPGLSSAQVYRLSTDRGQWVVKHTTTINLDGSTLELTARSAGVATARPVPPPPPAAGYWTTWPGGFVRVSEAVRGRPPRQPASPPVARWLGETIAAITGLGLEPAAVVPWRPPSWPQLLPSRERALVSCLDELSALVGEAQADAPPRVLAHRDMSARNILITDTGPVLLDFDHTGAVPPWWELVHHTMLLACQDLGADEPDETAVRTAVAAYQDRGGEPGPAQPQAFAALVAGLLDWVRVNAQDEAVLRQAAVSLPRVASGLERWSRLLA